MIKLKKETYVSFFIILPFYILLFFYFSNNIGDFDNLSTSKVIFS